MSGNMGELKFIPQNEIQTREWFVAHLADFDYNIVKSASAFPDYILEGLDGTSYRVEVESESANFIRHKHNAAGCDFVLCWIHNAKLVIPVLELSSKKWFEASQTSEQHYDVSLAKVTKSSKRIDARRIKIQGLCESVLIEEHAAFMAAFAGYLKAKSEYLSAIQPSYFALLSATSDLSLGIRGRKVDIGKVSPEEMFALLGL